MVEEINKIIDEAFDYPIRVNLPEDLKENKELISAKIEFLVEKLKKEREWK